MQPDDRQARRQERWARREQRRQERWERRQSCGSNPLGGAIIGLLLIGGGLLFLLRNLGIVYFDNLWDYWPVILIAWGVSKLFSSRGGDIIGGLIIGGIGTVFLLRNLGIIYGNVWGFIWPAVFIAIGLSLLLKNLYGPDWFHGGVPADPATPSPNASTSDADRITADLIFTGLETKNVSQNFEGGRVSVFFGGAVIDLRGAATRWPEIAIQADAVFGGIELRVPDHWYVEVRGSGMFGGYEDRTHHPAVNPERPAPKITVRGSAIFGGVTVRN